MPFYVYVIELDPQVRKSRKFLERNAGMLPYGRCFYVGQSIHEPDCRYRQHKECHGPDTTFSCICAKRVGRLKKKVSNHFARKYGQRLHREAFERHNPVASRAAAERLESELARELQADGHGVWWG